MRSALPAGTVTFVFTDIEGSTKLMADLGEEPYADALANHRRVVREAFSEHGGVEVDTQGDAFFYAFSDAGAAVLAAKDAQASLASGPIKVRMGLHTGAARLGEEGYVGSEVHRAARIAAAAHGGQVLLSRATRQTVTDTDLTDLGEHRLKDFVEPVWLFQLGSKGFPPLRTLSNTNLPRPPATFVGREREVADITALLRQGSRLVSLTGPGGSGKTRLAIEAAADLVPEVPNGTFWVDLAPLKDAALVNDTIGHVLGANDGLAEHIGERDMLLVLDNLEQVIDAAPGLVRLLTECPNLRVLATSRELLRVSGEVEFAVPPLDLDEAVELFARRANISPDETVAELCRRLDNLPLAVELAAARTSVLTPTQILARISQRLDLLKGGRDAEARQQTLRATIEWSYDLLTPQEQTVFANLGVFAGGWTLGAAEEVAGADLDSLQSLAEKSLIRRQGDRFSMLETIRAYAAERLDGSGRADEVHQRHVRFFLRLAESANLSEDTVPAGEQRMDLVLPEIDNCRSALQWASTHDELLAVSLATALALFWVTNSPAEGRRWISQLLERNPDIAPELRARTLRTLGGVIYITGDFAEGTRLHEEALALFRELGDDFGIAQINARLAIEAQRAGDPENARELAEEVLDVARQAGDRWLESQALYTLGDVAYTQGRAQEAITLMQESADAAAAIGFHWWRVGSLGHLTEYAILTERPDLARAAARQGLELAHSMGDRQSRIYLLSYLAWMAANDKDAERAGTIAGGIEAEEQRGRIGQWEAQRDEYTAHLDPVRGELFDQARARGRAMTIDEAVDYALRPD